MHNPAVRKRRSVRFFFGISLIVVFFISVFNVRGATNRSAYIPYDYSWYAAPDFKYVALDQIHQQIFLAWTALDRIEEMGWSNKARPETVERLRAEYADRIRQLSRKGPHEKAVGRLFSRDFEELAREALQTERDTVITLRNEEAINDQVLRRIQRDIDLAEARLQRPK